MGAMGEKAVKTAYQQVEGFLHNYMTTKTRYELILGEIEFMKTDHDSVTTAKPMSHAPGRGSSGQSPVEAAAIRTMNDIGVKEIEAKRIQRVLSAYDIAMKSVTVK